MCARMCGVLTPFPDVSVVHVIKQIQTQRYVVRDIVTHLYILEFVQYIVI